jgi:hypothetical protein
MFQVANYSRFGGGEMTRFSEKVKTFRTRKPHDYYQGLVYYRDEETTDGLHRFKYTVQSVLPATPREDSITCCVEDEGQIHPE